MADLVDTLRPVYDAWGAGDWSAGTELYAPDVVLTIDAQPEGDMSRRGREEMARFMREFLRDWEEYRVEADEFLRPADDTVLVVGRQFGRGKASGVEMEIPVYNLWRFRDGLATELRFMVDGPIAFEAAGLDPGDAPPAG